MFDFNPPELSYRDPWRTPFNVRMAELHRGGTRIAYYYHVPDNSTFRYRCYSMVQAINDAGSDLSAAYFHAADGVALYDVLARVDVLVVGRSKYTARLDSLITMARSRGIRVLFDCDDLVFMPQLATLITTTLDQDMSHDSPEGNELWDVWFAYLGRLRATMLLCDGFITTNPLLVEEGQSSTGLGGSVVPNFMTNEQVDYSRELVELRRSTGHSRDGRVHVGYFSGTPTHNKDFALVHHALRAVLKAHPEVKLRLVGYLDLKGTALDGLEDQIEWLPFTDFLNLQRLIATTEINIAPLQDNRFTNCKSELKFFDAGAVAVPTLASPTYTMREAIADGVDGILVRNHEWHQKLETLISDYRRSAQSLGDAAYETAHSRYVPSAQFEAIVAAVGLA